MSFFFDDSKVCWEKKGELSFHSYFLEKLYISFSWEFLTLFALRLSNWPIVLNPHWSSFPQPSALLWSPSFVTHIVNASHSLCLCFPLNPPWHPIPLPFSSSQLPQLPTFLPPSSPPFLSRSPSRAPLIIVSPSRHAVLLFLLLLIRLLSLTHYLHLSLSASPCNPPDTSIRHPAPSNYRNPGKTLENPART